jgi:threonine dehydratase
MIQLEDIQKAATRLKGHVHRTPVVTSRAFNEIAGREVYFKCENLQRAGAFKIRGATNRILSMPEAERKHGVVAFSSGNHAQAVALASREAGIRAVIAMPTDAPKAKVEATMQYGADVRFYDRQKDDREVFARTIAESEQLTLVPPYDDYDIIAGQGTCALELMEDVRGLDALVTPCGGGGLFAGTSTAVKGLDPEISCYAVEAESADDTRQSFLAGKRISIAPPPTIADGMRNQSPGVLTFPILQKNADDMLLVSDEEIVATMKFLLFRMKLLVEPTGAASVAAVMFGRLPTRLKHVGVIISGGNVDPDTLFSLMNTAKG